MARLLAALTLTAAALVAAAPATAGPPSRTTSVLILGPEVVEGVCDFAFTQTVERTRTTTTFENGDVRRHVELIVSTSANGRTWIDRGAYNVFVAAASPTLWVITGAFTHTRAAAEGTILLQSGRILYDLEADRVVDPHEGPHGTGADPAQYDAAVCAALAPTA